MFKSKLNKRHAIFTYAIFNVLYLVLCSIQKSYPTNGDNTNLNKELLLNTDLLIKFVNLSIPEISPDCTDGLEISPLMSIQSNGTLNEENILSQQSEIDQLVDTRKNIELSNECEEQIECMILPDNGIKLSKRNYSDMYIEYLKTLKESGGLHKRDVEHRDLHKDDKLSYLQKNPPVTGSFMPDEPKIIRKRARPNFPPEHLYKANIRKKDGKDEDRAQIDIMDIKKIKLNKPSFRGGTSKEPLSPYDLVILELKSRLESIRNKRREVEFLEKEKERGERGNQRHSHGTDSEIQREATKGQSRNLFELTNLLKNVGNGPEKLKPHSDLKETEEGHKTSEVSAQSTRIKDLIKRFKTQVFLTPQIHPIRGPEGNQDQASHFNTESTGETAQETSSDQEKDMPKGESLVLEPGKQPKFLSIVQLMRPLELSVRQFRSLNHHPSNNEDQEKKVEKFVSRWKGAISSANKRLEIKTSGSEVSKTLSLSGENSSDSDDTYFADYVEVDDESSDEMT
ncbi:uncharacterized protein cubi_00636 [Cryptosporidium ubiquitum]|uniref:Uncharacterized protein n=1 Tax=Cryptosporidium ubiquitum TaxID=857276 RepID=A0A1J4MFM1_9CRYT|nr:uncharacterized protein cubi_00636 [Cryptosporidium ubiquitum]OII71828.1 hypothetical protein cubi_00636 [Cryptosporidium ubiquitum]